MVDRNSIPEETVGEVWVPIAGWVGIYSVSSLGRVRRDRPGRGTRPGFIPSVHTYRDTYPAVMLHDGERHVRRRVHVLVAEAFLGPRPPGKHINHISGMKKDSRASNLEYVSPSQNTQHARGLWDRGIIKSFGNSKLTSELADEIRAMVNSGSTQKEAAETYGVSQTTISSVVRHKAW